MSKKMLIDASHQEETRVVIVEGSRIEELDFESQNKRQLRGNVYLARVTRVEPSLQAAFVEYGGNRHGFLAFSEIHPDYYQIPYEDRVALIEDEEAENKAEDEEDADEDTDTPSNDSDDSTDDEDVAVEDSGDDEDVVEEQEKTASSRMRRMSRRRYKIQEVIKRGQILLIQVVKEERGNKGAAMTTYLSLAGRYCVLMPNTPRGGGISRKIPNGADRKRIKAVVSEFDVPQGMGVIVRTAGAKRTKLEIKRDYDYLCRLWETTRETTLKSIAPALIHEEGNLVKRSIRDLYNKDIDEVLVQGDEAYKTAKSFIKMLMPSHAKNVKAYKDPIPLFLRYQVESQIEDGLDSVVQLKSGGYLVIHPTEALVSVDVNSGRSTRERNVERTALKTNLEAADEVARQMRLRDLAGLVVIDFIDMDENRNNRAVEKRMKDALARDRARVQSSRISQFGLMEISRQRRRRSLLEGSTAHCEHCAGVGRQRTVESSALRAIRAVEEIGVRGKAKRILLKVAPDVALYIFNEKRDLLNEVESQFNVFTELKGDDTLMRPSFEVEVLEASEADVDPLVEIEKELRKENQKAQAEKSENRKRQSRKKADEDKDSDEKSDRSDSEERSETQSDDDEDQPKRRRRRGRRGGRRRKTEDESSSNVNDSSEKDDSQKAVESTSDDSEGNDKSSADQDKPKRRRRRSTKSKDAEVSETVESSANAETGSDASSETKTVTDGDKSDAPKAKPRRRRKKAVDTPEAEAPAQEPATETSEKPKPMRSTTRRKAPTKKPAPEAAATEADDAKHSEAKASAEADAAPAKPKRKRAPRKKATPKKEAAKKPEAPADETAKPKADSKDDAPKSGDKPARSTTRRKAPTRKPKAEDAVETKDASAPAAKEQEKAKPKKPAPKPAAPKAKAEESAPDAEEQSKGSKKRGWWRRK